MAQYVQFLLQITPCGHFKVFSTSKAFSFVFFTASYFCLFNISAIAAEYYCYMSVSKNNNQCV